MISNYKIVRGEIFGVEEAVNRLLGEGWQPLGQPFRIVENRGIDHDGSPVFFDRIGQAMAQFSEEEKIP